MSQEPKEKEDAFNPSWIDYRANLSALLYIITDQQVILGRLMEELLKRKVLDGASLTRITAGRNDIEVLAPSYTELYKDFAEYFVRIKIALEELERKGNEDEGKDKG